MALLAVLVSTLLAVWETTPAELEDAPLQVQTEVPILQLVILNSLGTAHPY